MATLPNKTELAAIDEAIKESEARPIEARAAAIKAFSAGEFTSESVGSWFAVQQAERPELWTGKKAEADHSAHAELAEQAFTGGANGKGSPGARGDLIRALGGEAQADKLAKQYGLEGVADWKTKATVSEGTARKISNNPDNPFTAAGWNITKQGDVIKALGQEKAADLARAAGVTIGATRPAKAA